MKKYRVTEKHGLLKKGIVLDYNINDSLVYLFPITEYINKWIERDWIEEIQEHEFAGTCKDSVVAEGYKRASNSDYNFRRVLKDLDNDLYYSGWMDCFDWIEGQKKL